jgi:hypothetical protein
MAKAPKGVTHARPKSKDDKGDKDKKEAVQTPTQFGSHASMTNEELTGQIAAAKQDAGDPWVILLDERGHYATRKSKLDSGLADPNRLGDATIRDQRIQELTAK